MGARLLFFLRWDFIVRKVFFQGKKSNWIYLRWRFFVKASLVLTQACLFSPNNKAHLGRCLFHGESLSLWREDCFFSIIFSSHAIVCLRINSPMQFRAAALPTQVVPVFNEDCHFVLQWTRQFKILHAIWTAGEVLLALLLLPDFDYVDRVLLDPTSWEVIFLDLCSYGWWLISRQTSLRENECFPCWCSTLSHSTMLDTWVGLLLIVWRRISTCFLFLTV